MRTLDSFLSGITSAITEPAPRDAMYWRERLRSLLDRKSTRLNSSHLGISYAVFCLKKKKINNVQIASSSRKGRESCEHGRGTNRDRHRPTVARDANDARRVACDSEH